MSEDFDIMKVREYLPHRYPFLLIDRVLEYEADKRLVALKNVTMNEPFFQGHFPQRPVMPGVLIVEALAQATSLLALRSDESHREEGQLYYLAGVDKARFKRQVEPGDQLTMEVTLERSTRGVAKFSGVASVGEEVAVTCEIMGALRDSKF